MNRFESTSSAVCTCQDNRAITFERLRIAKEQARLEEPQEVREVFFHNLAQVKQWIEDPGFEHDEKFKP